MDIRRLKSFIVIVDSGSITRAADILHLAQPALSQQLAALEDHFGQKLLIRSQQGVTMTDAGHAVYRHAQIILRQMEQAQVDVSAAGNSIAGRVSVGLVPFSSAATLSVELLAETRKRHPGILIHLTESVGQTYSQMIMNGRLELALIHGVGPIKGVKFEPMLSEEFYLVAHRDFAIEADSKPVPIAALDGMPMLMPPAYNFVRRAVDTAFTRSRINLKVVAEVEIVRTLARAVASGLGATIMPKAIANRIVSETSEPLICRLLSPRIEETLSLCMSDQNSLSEPAFAVKDILVELTEKLKL
ncbi:MULTISPECIES: nitrogen assimilation transcriptional regulator NAC [Rhizobium/Agrobacterium group]|jgi:LysR family nitrogen assimilation transcriptional regulator|uniref:HTH-type transcriptional regulator TtuA n=2 Tax=Rhizobium/Agrobacterium group TaxID=227290 RepID=A0A1V2AN21_AGRTU|nr:MULTISPECIES: nitrogen assimilation transcriptional regulator NAC [Rhizobium/Agrobacterium group]AHK03734.1 nitrogen assimilation regulatory protein Nac [Agrobacterium tumefaciens LBA4213 (Ach5)]AKC09495.1 LysR family transcriptional regulator [Agrobacterium tumefaciens]EHJ95859.1 nitrogen assimilation regulatory protein [Agrobacterium tumefaciens 5A]MDP9562944.1 LysR family nitrogen assimilation transcriptional regulator [Rhizobium nepotum]HCV70629.1 nitrogen assimilation transcriptional r